MNTESTSPDPVNKSSSRFTTITFILVLLNIALTLYVMSNLSDANQKIADLNVRQKEYQKKTDALINSLSGSHNSILEKNSATLVQSGIDIIQDRINNKEKPISEIVRDEVMKQLSQKSAGNINSTDPAQTGTDAESLNGEENDNKSETQKELVTKVFSLGKDIYSVYKDNKKEKQSSDDSIPENKDELQPNAGN